MSAYPEDIGNEAWKTTMARFNAISDELDLKHGPGYAKEHPQLVADFMHSAAIDFQTLYIGKQISDVRDVIADFRTSV